MVSEFRKQKYYYVFATFLDFDRNGKINMRDVEVLTERMCQHKPYNKEDMIVKWWQMLNGMLEYIGVERRDVMYYDDWVATWSKFAENPNETEWYTAYRHYVFEYYKDEERNEITPESQFSGFSPFGIDREEALLAFKKAMPDKNSISKVDFLKLWNEYFTSDDAPGNFISGTLFSNILI